MWEKRSAKTSNLDEMQEQKLLHIEKSGFWILFWILAVTILAEMVLGYETKVWIGEAICFLISSIVLMIQCIRNGIWNRRLRADFRTNLIVSGVAAVAVAVISLAICFTKGEVLYRPAQIVLILAFPAVVTFALTLLLLSICSGFYKKKVRELENEPED